MKPTIAAGFLLAVLGAMTSWLAIAALDPPAAVPAEAAPDRFSAGRAMEHLQVLAAEPRSMGSPGHATSLAYLQKEIRSLGLEPQVQVSTAQLAAPRQGWVTFVTLQNVLVRLRGKLNANPILLSSHYDSVSNSPGAGDDGFGVVTLLESMRTLTEGPALDNDLIFLFTDAEELGLLGAEAFMDEHPWASQVKMLLNFDALGVRGPVTMFETTEGNGRLIRELARAADHPAAFSFSTEVYNRLPSDTDFSTFRRGGAPGYNFSLIDGPTGYHTPLDDLEHIEADSLQHGGETTVSLVRQIDKAGIEGEWKGEDSIYFSLLGRWLIAYPKKLALLLTAALVLGVGFLIALGFSRRRCAQYRLSAGRLVAAVVSVLLTVAGVTGLSLLAGRFLIPSSYRFLIWEGRDSHAVALMAIALLAVGVTVLISRWITKLWGEAHFTAAGLLVWLCLLVAATLRAPGVSYLFALPLLFALPRAAASLSQPVNSKPSNPLGPPLLAAVAVVVAALLWAPALALLTMALHGGAALWAGAALSLLLAGLLPGATQQLASSRAGLAVALGLIVAGLALGVSARAASRHGDDNPSVNTLLYAHDADSGQGHWITFDSQLDSWTSQFLGTSPEPKVFPKFFFHQNPVFSASTAVPALREDGPQPATINNVVERSEADRRILDFRVDWRNEPARSILTLRSSGEIQSLTVNGRKVEQLDDLDPGAAFGTRIRYYAPPSTGIEVKAELIPASATLTLDVLGDWFELPQIEGFPPPERPAAFIARNSVMVDSTLVVNSFDFSVAEEEPTVTAVQ